MPLQTRGDTYVRYAGKGSAAAGGGNREEVKALGAREPEERQKSCWDDSATDGR